MEGSGIDDWALERESELIRLEYENYELRRMLGISTPTLPESLPSDGPPRLEATAEGDHQQQQSGLGMFTGPFNQQPKDDLTLRRQPSHTQGLTQLQISLESAQQPHLQTQPLHITFPPDTPLVTRKYGGRRTGSGSFIGGSGGGGNFMNPVMAGDVSTNMTTAPFGKFRPSLASGPSGWPDVNFASGDRNSAFAPGQDRDTNPPGREGDMKDGLQPPPWDGLTMKW